MLSEQPTEYQHTRTHTSCLRQHPAPTSTTHRIAPAHGPALNLCHVYVAQRKHAEGLEQLARSLLEAEHNAGLEGARSSLTLTRQQRLPGCTWGVFWWGGGKCAEVAFNRQPDWAMCLCRAVCRCMHRQCAQTQLANTRAHFGQRNTVSASPGQLDEARDVLLVVVDVFIKDFKAVQLSSTPTGNSTNTLLAPQQHT